MGDKTVSEVTVVDVNSFRQGLLATGLSRRTCDLHLATLRALYNVSRKQGVYAGPNPAANPGMAPVACRTGYLTASNVQAFHQALALEPCPSAAAALLLLLYTGGRKNEILTAKWADIDLERHLITVPVARSKTKRARYISLTPHAEEIILAQSRRRQADNPFVFPSDRNPGRPLADLRGPWSRAKAAANLPPDSVIHTLRHSFGSALASEGVPLNEIAELLGHSQLATTMRYAHLSPERLTDTASIAAKAWGMPATNERNVE